MSINFEVKLESGESFEHLLKRFKKKTTKEKILEECIERSCYTKKSDKKRKQRERSKFLRQRENEKLHRNK